MDFAFSDKALDLQRQVREFMESEVMPAESVYREQVAASGNPHHHPQVMEELKAKARSAGLWNLFLPDPEWGAGLTNLEYAPLAELMGRSVIGPEAFNCNAPDTGNMEVLAQYGTRAQQEEWLVPLLAGEIRSCFSMTEPDVASSDATNIQSRIERDGDHYVINGRKWWTSGAARERCRISIFMGKTDPEAPLHQQQSMILVPLDTPGISTVRTLSVFGYDEGEGHVEQTFTDVRVPAGNLLQEEGDGFRIAQGRLGPGRIHHCMRLIGMAERAVELMCQRVISRTAFGKPLARQGVIQNWIAESRCEIEQARLLVLKAAWMMDTVGNKAAKSEIAMIKIVAPRMAQGIIDRAIQAFGGAGVSQDTPLAQAYAHARTLRLADGPDEVHLMSLARRELKGHLAELG
ncbi:MAG TPA: acyl-CoA dehydrogenase family protein [Egibacteraceae bacterium]|nr:acyl-CoA dehydrogenase family protein [Egibacteraceae bacterium]